MAKNKKEEEEKGRQKEDGGKETGLARNHSTGLWGWRAGKCSCQPLDLVLWQMKVSFPRLNSPEVEKTYVQNNSSEL